MEPGHNSPPRTIDQSWVPRLLFGRTTRDDSNEYRNSSGDILVVPPFADVIGTLKN